jgi:5'-deoxynucleotidase YfbR-like HD superfamily hydrolase
MLELKTAAEFLRASHISRWGIVQTAHRQTIAEHMYRVWLLVRSWGPAAGLNPSEQRDAELLALMHDLPEIRTGDAPTPHKTPAVKEYLSGLEEQICPELRVVEVFASDRVKDLLKFCDTAEAVLFLKVNGLGQHAANVQELLEQQMLSRLGDSSIGRDQQQALTKSFITTKHDT